MVEKLIEMFTPEVIVIAIIALAALTILTFLMLLIKMVSLSRVKKRLLNIAERSLALEEKQATFRQDAQRANNTIANFAQTADKIESFERRLDELAQKIVESQNLFAGLESALRGHESALKGLESALRGHESTLNEHESTLKGHESASKGHESKLKEHDILLGQAGQMMGKEAAGFSQVIQRIRILEEGFQGLKVFQRTFEQTRNRILNILGGVPVEMPPHNTPTTERKDSKEETVIPSEGKLPQHRRLS